MTMRGVFLEAFEFGDKIQYVPPVPPGEGQQGYSSLLPQPRKHWTNDIALPAPAVPSHRGSDHCYQKHQWAREAEVKFLDLESLIDS